MKHKVEIQWSEDENDCETCGGRWSRGAVVKVDGETVLDKPAYAHFCNNVIVDESEVYKAILKHIGCEVIETGDFA